MARGFRRKILTKTREYAWCAFVEHDLGCTRTKVAKVVSQRHLCRFRNGAGELDADGAAAHEHEREQFLERDGIRVPAQSPMFGLFERPQNPAADLVRILQASSPGAIGFHSSWPK